MTCHRWANTAHWHLLIICPAPVHTSVYQVRVSDRLLVPPVWPPIHSHLSLCSHVFHSHPLLTLARSPLVTLAPISISISTSTFISASHSPYLCMWVCCYSLLLLASLLLPVYLYIYFQFFLFVLLLSIPVPFKLGIIFFYPQGWREPPYETVAEQNRLIYLPCQCLCVCLCLCTGTWPK